jgi:hypothetical protein
LGSGQLRAAACALKLAKKIVLTSANKPHSSIRFNIRIV